MSDPISLRNIPPDVLKLAHVLSAQTGLSMNDVFRLALASGLLIEATKVTPKADGTLGGWEGPALAKALRRHLGSAIDILLEYEEHPYQSLIKSRQEERTTGGTHQRVVPKGVPSNERPIEPSIGDDLEALGFGSGLSEAVE